MPREARRKLVNFTVQDMRASAPSPLLCPPRTPCYIYHVLTRPNALPSAPCPASCPGHCAAARLGGRAALDAPHDSQPAPRAAARGCGRGRALAATPRQLTCTLRFSRSELEKAAGFHLGTGHKVGRNTSTGTAASGGTSGNELVVVQGGVGADPRVETSYPVENARRLLGCVLGGVRKVLSHNMGLCNDYFRCVGALGLPSSPHALTQASAATTGLCCCGSFARTQTCWRTWSAARADCAPSLRRRPRTRASPRGLAYSSPTVSAQMPRSGGRPAPP